MEASIEQMSFEAALTELEAIVEKLEDGTLDLNQTVILYQRGRALAARCQQLLDTVELQIQQLTPAGVDEPIATASGV
ncbi:MAG TPA: exodeoxyribonuclease VII small subunit [Anaerolineae bacterium]|mgnify:CR=1 FL=1|nr:exodeoxyribonuclease VII small subunit [Anaerolineae bacterium]HQK15606.1 exodeoxyribonuclease VII small subunit [Anaerolineae bacterium]